MNHSNAICLVPAYDFFIKKEKGVIGIGKLLNGDGRTKKVGN